MNLLFIASSMAPLVDVVIIPPILLVIIAVGTALLFTRFRLLANVFGGILVLYACVQIYGDREVSLEYNDLAGFLYVCIFVSLVFSLFWVVANTIKAPEWPLIRWCRYSLIRGLFLTISICIQFFTVTVLGVEFRWSFDDPTNGARQTIPQYREFPPTDYLQAMDHISLEHPTGNGYAAYKITLFADGSLYYEGIASVACEGRRWRKINPSAYYAIMQKVNEIGFWNYKDLYPSHWIGEGGLTATGSNPRIKIVEVRQSPRTKRVVDEWDGPSGLIEVDKMMGKLGDVGSWIVSTSPKESFRIHVE